MNNSILIRWDTFHINHRLLREERVGRQARHQIDREADDGPVSGVLDLRDVLKLTVEGLDQSPLAQEDFVRDCHKLALHVALKLCYQLDAVHEKSGEEVPADVSLVSDQLSEDPFDEGFVPERIPVVNIAMRSWLVYASLLSKVILVFMALSSLFIAFRELIRRSNCSELSSVCILFIRLHKL